MRRKQTFTPGDSPHSCVQHVLHTLDGVLDAPRRTNRCGMVCCALGGVLDTPQRTREGGNLEGIDEEEADIDTRAREGVPPCTPETVLDTPDMVLDTPDKVLDTLDLAEMRVSLQTFTPAHVKGYVPPCTPGAMLDRS